MPNYAEQYFNQDDNGPRGYSPQNPTIIKEEIVSGTTTGVTYIAQLVKVVGAGVNLTTGDINVELSHTTDTVRLGDATTLTKVASGGFLLISGLTNIENVNTVSGHLKISGVTSIQDVSVSGNSLQTIITDNEGHIGQIGGHSKKPQIKITRPANTTTYSILDIINSASTVMERFNVARSNNKNSIVFAAHMTISTSASTALSSSLHLFNSGITISSDNTLWQPNVNELDHHLGVIDFSTSKVLGNRSVYEGVLENPILLTMDPDNPSSVWGALISRNAYVPPSNSEVISISLDVAQD